MSETHLVLFLPVHFTGWLLGGNQSFFFSFSEWVRVWVGGWVGDWGLPREKDLFGRIFAWSDGGDGAGNHWFS